ncbi:sigma 54-interacting transcriptional regulator [Paradesulfitobacterium aromaticivorans]
MLAKELMEQAKVILTPDNYVTDALPILQKVGLTCSPVLENGEYLGMLSLSFITLAALQQNKFIKVREVVDLNWPVVSPNTLIEEINDSVVELFPVTTDKKLLGVLPITRVFRALQLQLKSQFNANKVLEALIDSSYDGIYITDGQGITLAINKATERITGLFAKDLVGRNMKDLVKEGVFSESVTLKVLKEKKSITLVQRLINGRRTLVTGNPVFDANGEIIRVITNVRDTTELNRLREELEQSRQLTPLRIKEIQIIDIVAQSKEMLDVLDLALLVARVDTPVLILGETGVGKEVIAQLIHRGSSRHEKGSFIKLNCGAIPEELLESELFGYESGAFTGARKEGKPGIFELANEGTLFLDEIADLPLVLQVKLLRVLQDQEFMRVGGIKPIRVNVRILAATNKDLEKLIQAGEFREDLFYRMNVIPIYVPPLRTRREDISSLLDHYLHVFNKKYSVNKEFSEQFRSDLISYNWPGNVRELANLTERLVITSRENTISLNHLPSEYRKAFKVNEDIKITDMSLRKGIANLEKELITRALHTYRSTYKAAKALGMSQSFVARRAKKYGLSNYNDRETY